MRTRSLSRAVAAGTAVVLATLAACSSGGGAPSGDPAAPTRGGTLVVAKNTLPTCLDPSISVTGNDPGRQTVDTLVDQDQKTGEIVPWLATKWTESPDGLTYTFTLRDGVTFSNGEPFTAAAVKAGMDDAVGFAKKYGQPSSAGNFLTAYASSSVIDDRTVQITLKKPSASFLQLLSDRTMGIIAPSSLGGSYADRCSKGVIGTGPFTITENVKNDHITVVRRPGYAWPSPNSTHGDEAYLDAIRFVEIPEASVQTQGLLSKNVDVIVDPAAADIPQLEATGVKINTNNSEGVPSSIFPNLTRAPMTDPAVRDALQIGIDREEILAGAFNKFTPQVTSALTPGVPGYVDLSSKLKYDPDRAARILDDAGWVMGADGVRAKDGQRLKVIYEWYFAPVQSAVLLVQAQLKKLGFDIELKRVTLDQIAAEGKGGDWDLRMTGRPRPDADAFFAHYGAASLFTSFTADNSADLQALLTKQTSETDVAARKATIGQIQNLIVDDGYGFPLNVTVRYGASAPNVSGVKFIYSGYLSFYDTTKSAK
ncbi:ABC transporter substrate-binding protein [Pseudonocardia ailaonensis]|uniref:ABC transporter substrate-binding protein n=1 Tax=Pseudonocardia ailaonensis TaxID=367279 RepID=A0ABN2NBR2_9PSEU